MSKKTPAKSSKTPAKPAVSKTPAKPAASQAASAIVEPKPEKKIEPQGPPKEINLKEAAAKFFNNNDEELKNASRWPLLIDETERFSAFCRHRDTRYVDCMNKDNLELNSLRLKILSAYFYGHLLIIDFMGSLEMLKLFEDACNQIDKNLFADICNKSLKTNDQRYKDLIRDSDGDEYVEWKIRENANFGVLFLTTKPEVAPSLPYTLPYIMM